MSFLGSLVGRIEQGAQNAEHTIGNAIHPQPSPASTATPQQNQTIQAINKAVGSSGPSAQGQNVLRDLLQQSSIHGDQAITAPIPVYSDNNNVASPDYSAVSPQMQQRIQSTPGQWAQHPSFIIPNALPQQQQQPTIYGA